jgi:hypothetical protein
MILSQGREVPGRSNRGIHRAGPFLGRNAAGSTPTPILKASRAYIAGLGTTGVLIGCFLLLLAVVSTIVAFRGAPGEASNDGLGRLDMSDTHQAAGVTGAGASGGAAGEKGTGRGERGRARGARGARLGGRAGAAGERAVGGLASGGPVGGPIQAGGPAQAGGSDAGPAGELTRLPVDPRRPGGMPSPPSVGDVANGLGDVVEEAGNGLGETVGSVAPPLEEPIVRTGEAVAGVVEQAAPVLDRTVNDATGAARGVTDRVTGVTDRVTGATDRVTGAVGQATGGLVGGD